MPRRVDNKLQSGKKRDDAEFNEYHFQGGIQKFFFNTFFFFFFFF